MRPEDDIDSLAATPKAARGTEADRVQPDKGRPTMPSPACRVDSNRTPADLWSEARSLIDLAGGVLRLEGYSFRTGLGWIEARTAIIRGAARSCIAHPGFAAQQRNTYIRYLAQVKALKEWNMTESFAKEWMRQTSDETHLDVTRKHLLMVLGALFSGAVPRALRDTIAQQPSLAHLEAWFVQANRVVRR